MEKVWLRVGLPCNLLLVCLPGGVAFAELGEPKLEGSRGSGKVCVEEVWLKVGLPCKISHFVYLVGWR